ncbi:secreted chorismate mutase [Mycolicibacterium cyprinidarum]|uniref:Chorismate mutase n=1 Tax=Mycolicibacterium cyprinidarum TaxID=2860311 RepID=A0ABQ4VJ19_9MYCO|nr:secreted chorismate mutase [Mycolicibacterium sp. NGTWS0302]GJF18754.1 secreted chorismate mutase [Mycolicibacterium sp. NGTWSNA01]
MFNWMVRTAAPVVAVGLLVLTAPASYAQPNSSLNDLVDAAARRLQIAEPVAASKFHTGGPIEDPVREQQVLDYVSAEATTLRLDPAYVTAAFRDQIDATVAIEYSRLSQWTLDPASAPAQPPDLAASRGIIDALNREMVTLMADQWDVLHSATCGADLDVAKAMVAQARAMDPLYRQAIDFATRNYCR